MDNCGTPAYDRLLFTLRSDVSGLRVSLSRLIYLRPNSSNTISKQGGRRNNKLKHSEMDYCPQKASIIEKWPFITLAFFIAISQIVLQQRPLWIIQQIMKHFLRRVSFAKTGFVFTPFRSRFNKLSIARNFSQNCLFFLPFKCGLLPCCSQPKLFPKSLSHNRKENYFSSKEEGNKERKENFRPFSECTAGQ